MNNEIRDENEKEPNQINLDWEQRILCSDGNCIGVIGPDGNCKECGKKYDGTLPAEHFPDKEIQSEEDDAPGKSDQSIEAQMVEEASELNESDDLIDDDDWQDRVLCSDGNCIGVIGPDGRCKECGKPYDG